MAKSIRDILTEIGQLREVATEVGARFDVDWRGFGNDLAQYAAEPSSWIATVCRARNGRARALDPEAFLEALDLLAAELGAYTRGPLTVTENLERSRLRTRLAELRQLEAGYAADIERLREAERSGDRDMEVLASAARKVSGTSAEWLAQRVRLRSAAGADAREAMQKAEAAFARSQREIAEVENALPKFDQGVASAQMLTAFEERVAELALAIERLTIWAEAHVRPATNFIVRAQCGERDLHEPPRSEFALKRRRL